jgi:hypothetical protein
LATIGFDGKVSLNWLASAGLSKDPDLIAKKEDSKLPSVEKDIIHNLQQVIFGDDEPIKIPEFTGGAKGFFFIKPGTCYSSSSGVTGQTGATQRSDR